MRAPHLHAARLAPLALALAAALACAIAARAPAAETPSAAPEKLKPGASENVPLGQAQQLYDEARFQAAYDLLTKALHDGRVTGDDVVAARALRARCLVKMGRRLEAKEAFKATLRLDPAFRLDPALVPPDEVDSFRLAQQEIDSEQLEAGRRFPASIAFTIGRGNCVNQDLVDLASSAGAPSADDFSESGEASYSVRFPLRPRLSIDFSVGWLKATTADQLPVALNAHTLYTATAMPVLVQIVKNVSSNPREHVNVLAGLGPLVGQAILEQRNNLVAGRIVPTQVVGHKTGWCLQAGLEGEWLLRPRFALTAQALARRANTGALEWLRSDYQFYESYPNSTLSDRSIDFSGVAASIGVRAYIGY